MIGENKKKKNDFWVPRSLKLLETERSDWKIPSQVAYAGLYGDLSHLGRLLAWCCVAGSKATTLGLYQVERRLSPHFQDCFLSLAQTWDWLQLGWVL